MSIYTVLLAALGSFVLAWFVYFLAIATHE